MYVGGVGGMSPRSEISALSAILYLKSQVLSEGQGQ
jgi:hypothetical protein